MDDNEKLEIVIRTPDTLEHEDKDELIAKYITPHAKCVCCNLPRYSLLINEAYLNGFTYEKIVEQYGQQVFDKTGQKLEKGVLAEHFNNHFNFKGAAIAEYNRRRGMSLLPVQEKAKMRGIFDTLVDENINDLEVLQLTMREQVKGLKELEEIKMQRISEKRVFNLDSLIMKQHAIRNDIINGVLSKLKFWQKTLVDAKVTEQRERFLDFLDKKTADFLGIETATLTSDPKLTKEIERMYLTVVIDHLLKRVKDSMQQALSVNQQSMSQFLKEFKRQCIGIELEITNDFRERVKNIKNIKNVDLRKDSEPFDVTE
jgi:hypothetical protein